MRICYEWDRETVDPETGDILDHNYSKTLSPLIGEPGRLVLVRDVFDHYGDLENRSWAYVLPSGLLPNHFYDSADRPVATVPKRFHHELLRS